MLVHLVQAGMSHLGRLVQIRAWLTFMMLGMYIIDGVSMGA